MTTAAGYEADPALSPDGRRLAYTAEENGFNEIYVRPLGDGKRIQVTADRGQNISAVWSPDGEQLAYHSQARGGIWIVPASGGVAKQVVAVGSEPAWSPDGTMLAFSTYQGALAERAEIMVVPVAGGEARAVTRPGSPRGGHRGPAWSHDGQRVAFYTFDGSEGSSLWVAPAAGGDPVRVAAHVTPKQAAFTPDDRALCWSGTGPSVNVGIWCVRLDRASPAEPIAVLQGVAGVSGLSIARDGTIAYAVRRTESDLWSLPLSTAGEAAGDPVPLDARHQPQHVPGVLARRASPRLSQLAPRHAFRPVAHEHADPGDRAPHAGQRRRVLPHLDAGQPSRVDGDRPRPGAPRVACGHRYPADRGRSGFAGADEQSGPVARRSRSRVSRDQRAAAG